MKKRKVLFVATVVKTHIMQFHIPYLAMLQDMGWETAVASRNDYENPEDCVIPHCDAFYDIPFERLPWKKDNLKAYRMLKKLINEGDYDLIHCHTPVGAMLCRLAAMGARRRGTKVYYTAHGFHFFKGAPLVNWLVYFPAEWLLAPLTDLLITINREDYARAKKCLYAKQIAYVPGVGIDAQRFRLPDGTREAKRQELGYGNEDFLILTVAEMTANKNHITVLKALAELKDREEFKRIHYLICGRGEQRAALEEQTEQLGLRDHVQFLGYRTDAPELYACCDLFAFMPYREGLSVALTEAMSSGMAVVCTKIRGNTDLIDDGVSGLFCENNAKALAKTILELIADEPRRRALGRGAAEKALLFDKSNVHTRMEELYCQA